MILDAIMTKEIGVKQSNIPVLGILATALVFVGCASTPPPLGEIASSETAISFAEQADAQDQAPLEMNSARRKLKYARAAMASEDYATARRYAEQAQVEAELAQAKSQSAKAQQSVQQVRESIRILREEIGGSASLGIGAP